MKVILAIPVVLVKMVADCLFGPDKTGEALKVERYRAQHLMVMGRMG